MLLEPLTEIFKSKADQLNDRLCEIRDNLTLVVGNTEAQLAQTQRNNKKIFADPTTWETPELFNPKIPVALGTLRNETGYGWIVKFVANPYNWASVRLFYSEYSFTGYIGIFPAQPTRLDFYVPPGGILIAEFLQWGKFTEEEEDEGKEPNRRSAVVNLHIEELIKQPAQGRTGRSEEHVTLPQREPVIPSPHPLDEATAPPRL